MTTVFISSTCYDLVDLRAEVELHLRSLGLDPVMSDRLSSNFLIDSNVDSVETCLVNVRKSDIFVLVLSQRYGPLIPGKGPQISAIHMEWREAVREKKKRKSLKVLTYVRDQLLAEYQIWKKDPSFEGRWVRDKDKGVFGLIKEIEPLRKGRSNWLWPFRDVVELKARLSKDLAVESATALLSKLVADGLLPALVVGATPRSEEGLVFFSLSNYHSEPAIQPRLSVEDDYDGTVVPFREFSATAIAPEKDWTIEMNIPVKETMIVVNLKLRYHTRFGHEIEEVFMVAFPGPEKPWSYPGSKRLLGPSRWTRS